MASHHPRLNGDGDGAGFRPKGAVGGTISVARSCSKYRIQRLQRSLHVMPTAKLRIVSPRRRNTTPATLFIAPLPCTQRCQPPPRATALRQCHMGDGDIRTTHTDRELPFNPGSEPRARHEHCRRDPNKRTWQSFFGFHSPARQNVRAANKAEAEPWSARERAPGLCRLQKEDHLAACKMTAHPRMDTP